MKASIWNLMLEFNSVFLKKVELEIRDITELKALLPLLTHKNFNSDVELNF